MADNNKGFAGMDPNKAHEIQSEGGKASAQKQDMSKLGRKGGKAAHPHGRGLQNASEEVREEVARKGGQS